MSNLGPDTQDFYVEKLDDPKAPTHYEFQGEWHDLEIAARRSPSRAAPRWCWRSAHPPRPADERGDGGRLKDSEPLALKWAHARDASRSSTRCWGSTWRRLRGVLRAAIKRWEMPGQNFVYADTAGNIGYQATGKIPIRVRSPGPGAHAGLDGRARVDGLHPLRGAARVLQPARGLPRHREQQDHVPTTTRTSSRTTGSPATAPSGSRTCWPRAQHTVESMRASRRRRTRCPPSGCAPSSPGGGARARPVGSPSRKPPEQGRWRPRRWSSSRRGTCASSRTRGRHRVPGLVHPRAAQAAEPQAGPGAGGALPGQRSTSATAVCTCPSSSG